MINFLDENLGGAEFGESTRDLVRAALPTGILEETADGWPYLILPHQSGDGHVVDAPLGYGTLEQLSGERGAQVILFGLGIGHAARAIRSSGARLCFIYEPDPGVVRGYLERGPYDLAGVRVVSDLSELEQAWPQLVGDASKIQLIETPGYSQARPGDRAALTDMIGVLLERKVVNDVTLRARGKLWVQDAIDNASFMSSAPSAMFLHGAFAGVPAFIVGAGPSLSRNVELLRVARQKGIVFAVNASGGALDRAGIEPQVLGCIESLDLSHLLKGLSFIDRTVRILSLAAHPALFEAGSGPVLSMFELLPQFSRPLEAFFRRSAVPVCGSVTTAMVSLALRMGCSPIVLVGQDLAFTEGRAYSSGTAYAENELKFASDGSTVQHFRQDSVEHPTRHEGPAHERVERVPAWGGGSTVVSTANFGHVRLWLERFSALVAKLAKPPRMINATEGGSSIAGFEEKTLAEVLHDLPDVTITASDIVREAKTRGPDISLADVSEFLLIQAETARRVGMAASSLSDASRRAAASWQNAAPDSLKALMDELREKEQALKSAVAASPWVDTWCWREVDEVVSAAGGKAEHASAVAMSVENEGRLARVIETAAGELAARLETRAATLFGDIRVSA
jgi:HPt (histidine-containing phosphotransfer) domain-containing protein